MRPRSPVQSRARCCVHLQDPPRTHTNTHPHHYPQPPDTPTPTHITFSQGRRRGGRAPPQCRRTSWATPRRCAAAGGLVRVVWCVSVGGGWRPGLPVPWVLATDRSPHNAAGRTQRRRRWASGQVGGLAGGPGAGKLVGWSHWCARLDLVAEELLHIAAWTSSATPRRGAKGGLEVGWCGGRVGGRVCGVATD